MLARARSSRSRSSLLTDPDALPEHLIAGVAAGGFLLVAALAYPAGMGMGDVKLAVVMGLFLGRDVGAAMLVALVAGSLVGVADHRPQGRRGGPQDRDPVRPVPRPRRPRRAVRRRRRSSTGTSTPSSDLKAWSAALPISQA